MKTDILIVGAGISGLSLLHFLKAKDSSADVLLLEKESLPGGTIRSFPKSGVVFEHGPNGILANQPLSLRLFSELGLEKDMIHASQSSKKRYILKNGKLNSVPSNPVGLLRSGYLTFPEMARAFGELFVAPADRPETIFDFSARRFGPAVAEKLFDPLIKGIYGGNARRLHMASAFPKIACLERESGSVIRGMIRRKKQNKNRDAQKMVSFQGGMQTVTDALAARYADAIRYSQDVVSVRKDGRGFIVRTLTEEIFASRVVVCAPAWAAARIMKAFDASLSETLAKIEYAPIAVVGFLIDKTLWKNPVEGYGYLVSSSEKTPVLGVLFEDQVFPREGVSDHMLLRVMIGGADYPDVIQQDRERLADIARSHLQKVLGFEKTPSQTAVKVWPRAIPQYTLEYASLKPQIFEKLRAHPGLHLLANYLDGVSFNDCVENSWKLSENLSRPS